MENISNQDFEKLENLLKNKRFQLLSTTEKQWVLNYMKEDEYTSMSELYVLVKSNDTEELEPNPKIKNRLDNSFSIVKKPTIFSLDFKTKMPIYQSVAVAMVFFCIGMFTNLFQTKPIVVHDTVQVIKYVPQQIIKEIRVPVAQQIPQNLEGSKKTPTIQTDDIQMADSRNESINTESSNPYIAQQQEIALNNVQRALDENNGSSMGNDTVLRKMLVTVY
jgi:hypothetical protein